MERFYERRLLGVAHINILDIHALQNGFCAPGWEGGNMNSIKETGIRNEFSVLSTRQDDHFYIVNSEFGTCTCPVGVSGATCKHQGAVAMKYHVAIINFIPSLTFEDRMRYGYVALGKRDYTLNVCKLKCVLTHYFHWVILQKILLSMHHYEQNPLHRIRIYVAM